MRFYTNYPINNPQLYPGWTRTVWGRRGEQRRGSLPYRQALQWLENLLITLIIMGILCQSTQILLLFLFDTVMIIYKVNIQMKKWPRGRAKQRHGEKSPPPKKIIRSFRIRVLIYEKVRRNIRFLLRWDFSVTLNNNLKWSSSELKLKQIVSKQQ